MSDNEILDLDENLPQSGESAAEDPNADENASESDDSVDLEVVSAVKDNEKSSKPPISLLDSKEEGNPSMLHSNAKSNVISGESLKGSKLRSKKKVNG